MEREEILGHIRNVHRLIERERDETVLRAGCGESIMYPAAQTAIKALTYVGDLVCDMPVQSDEEVAEHIMNGGLVEGAFLGMMHENARIKGTA